MNKQFETCLKELTLTSTKKRRISTPEPERKKLRPTPKVKPKSTPKSTPKLKKSTQRPRRKKGY